MRFYRGRGCVGILIGEEIVLSGGFKVILRTSGGGFLEFRVLEGLDRYRVREARAGVGVLIIVLVLEICLEGWEMR